VWRCGQGPRCSPCGASMLNGAADPPGPEQEKRVKEAEKRLKEEEKEAKAAEREAKKAAKEEKAALPKKPQSAYLLFSCERCALRGASHTRLVRHPHGLPRVHAHAPRQPRGPASSAPLHFYSSFSCSGGPLSKTPTRKPASPRWPSCSATSGRSSAKRTSGHGRRRQPPTRNATSARCVAAPVDA
jgi:hypothetical protein